MISGATFVPTQQLAAIAPIPQPSLSEGAFPPLGSTLSTATQPPVAKFGAGFLGAVLPTFQASVVQSPFTNQTIATPGAPTAPGENEFAASYAPQIYAIYINGVIANASVASTSLTTNLSDVQVAQPPIPGDPPAEVPGLPPIEPIPGAEGAQQIVNSVGRLAGSGRILSSAPPAHAHAAAKKAA